MNLILLMNRLAKALLKGNATPEERAILQDGYQIATKQGGALPTRAAAILVSLEVRPVG